MKELKSTIRKILFNYKDISDSMDVSDIKDIDDGLKKVILENSFEVNFRLLEKIRLDNAYTFLKNHNLNITEIAEMVGYNSAQSFRRAFKRLFGVSPTDVRKS